MLTTAYTRHCTYAAPTVSPVATSADRLQKATVAALMACQAVGRKKGKLHPAVGSVRGVCVDRRHAVVAWMGTGAVCSTDRDGGADDMHGGWQRKNEVKNKKNTMSKWQEAVGLEPLADSSPGPHAVNPMGPPCSTGTDKTALNRPLPPRGSLHSDILDEAGRQEMNAGMSPPSATGGSSLARHSNPTGADLGTGLGMEYQPKDNPAAVPSPAQCSNELQPPVPNKPLRPQKRPRHMAPPTKLSTDVTPATRAGSSKDNLKIGDRFAGHEVDSNRWRLQGPHPSRTETGRSAGSKYPGNKRGTGEKIGRASAEAVAADNLWKQFKSAADVESVLALLRDNQDKMDYKINALAFQQIGFHGSRLRGPDGLEVASLPEVRSLAARVEEQWEDWGTHSLVLLANGHARLGHGSPNLVATMVSVFWKLELSGRLARAKPFKLLGLLKSFARLGIRSPEVYDALQPRLCLMLTNSDMSVKELISVAHSLALAGYNHQDLSNALSVAVLPAVASLQPSEAAGLCWSLARYGGSTGSVLLKRLSSRIWRCGPPA
eukprot:jgi/Botrbrau1/21064/Bobra.0144s0063.1